MLLLVPETNDVSLRRVGRIVDSEAYKLQSTVSTDGFMSPCKLVFTSTVQLRYESRTSALQVNPFMGTLKPQTNGPYSWYTGC